MKCRQCNLEILIGEDGLCADCVSLRNHPDATASRTSLAGIPFQDMKQIDEADRFKLIANHLKSNPGQNIGVLLESDPANSGKADRYIAGVRTLVPGATAVKKPGVVAGTVTVIFKL